MLHDDVTQGHMLQICLEPNLHKWMKAIYEHSTVSGHQGMPKACLHASLRQLAQPC